MFPYDSEFPRKNFSGYTVLSLVSKQDTLNVLFFASSGHLRL